MPLVIRMNVFRFSEIALLFQSLSSHIYIHGIPCYTYSISFSVKGIQGAIHTSTPVLLHIMLLNLSLYAMMFIHSIVRINQIHYLYACAVPDLEHPDFMPFQSSTSPTRQHSPAMTEIEDMADEGLRDLLCNQSYDQEQWLGRGKQLLWASDSVSEVSIHLHFVRTVTTL